MDDKPPSSEPKQIAESPVLDRARASPPRWRTIRDAPGGAESLMLGLFCIVVLICLWHLLTVGETGERMVDRYTLPSISETLATFPQLWFDRALTLSTLWSLGRVLGGFVLAAAIGVPLGVLAGSYLRLNAFLKPISIFGRNVPIAALIPLTLIWFGLGEVQKIMFIFLASVAFVLFDTTGAIQAVPDRYLDTGYTLGARSLGRRALRSSGLWALAYAALFGFGGWLLAESTPDKPGLVALFATGAFWTRFLIGAVVGFALWFPICQHQSLQKVLLPLALPDIVNSLRLLFGIAFGYIMLAEVIDAKHGLGHIINVSQRQGPREHIYLALIIISVLAYGIDRTIHAIQRIVFPHLKNVEA